MIRTHLLIGVLIAAPSIGASQVLQEARGAADRFGPGFTALSEERVEFQLQQRAHVILLWITAGNSIELYYPKRSRDRTERRAGRHAINVTEVPSPIQSPELAGGPVGQPGQVAPVSGAGILRGNMPGGPGQEPTLAGYWVLVVTETPMLAPEITQRLERVARAGGGERIVERVAAALAPDPATSAVYVAAVAVQ